MELLPILLLAMVCSGAASTASCPHCRVHIRKALTAPYPSTATYKRMAVDLLMSLKTCAPEPLAYIDDHKYIQHNLGTTDGKAGFLFIQKLLCQDPTTFVNTVRAFQDGDCVFTHTDNGPVISFDVFRFENGLIVEHWDNIQRKAVKLLLSQKTWAPEPLSYIDDHKYIQHNVGAPDGKTGFIPTQKMLCDDPATFISPLRVFQDGDYVFTHTDNNPSVPFDVFRFEDGLIDEHWDHWQEKAARSNGAGHTMLDGPTQARDLDKTAANKVLLTNYVNDVVVKGNRANAMAYFNNAQYIQHNPLATGDGLTATAGLVASLPSGTNVCSRVRQVLGEGDFVLVMCDGTWGTNATAFYDLYRVENGKIAEHWDTIEQIPPCSQWGNTNGKF